MDFLPQDISTYVDAHTSAESALLNELNRETYLKQLLPQMISGNLQGSLLRMMSYMIHPNRILEIGTFTGYSAICLAQGLSEGGKLYTIDINDELTDTALRYFKEAGLENTIQHFNGNAIEIIPTLEETWDLVFIDADKINYSNYYDMVFDRLRPGGFIIADNVLWSGHVLNPTGDKDGAALDAFNKKVNADPRVENLILTVRDGLMLIRKK